MFRIILKKLREENKISQQQLANELKVSQSTVGIWENGKNKPEFDTLIKIADYFNISTDYLLGKSDDKKVPIHEIGKEEVTPDEKRLLNYFRNLNEGGQEIILKEAEALVLSGLYTKESYKNV